MQARTDHCTPESPRVRSIATIRDTYVMSLPKDDLKNSASTVEDVEMSKMEVHHQARGTVQLLDQNTVILIPTPSPDPKGNGHVRGAV